jgi:hypothetical protein
MVSEKRDCWVGIRPTVPGGPRRWQAKRLRQATVARPILAAKAAWPARAHALAHNTPDP